MAGTIRRATNLLRTFDDAENACDAQPEYRRHQGLVRHRPQRVPTDRLRPPAVDVRTPARRPGRWAHRPGSSAMRTRRTLAGREAHSRADPTGRPSPISLEARLIRPGHKVQLVEVAARQDGIEVALALPCGSGLPP